MKNKRQKSTTDDPIAARKADRKRKRLLKKSNRLEYQKNGGMKRQVNANKDCDVSDSPLTKKKAVVNNNDTSIKKKSNDDNIQQTARVKVLMRENELEDLNIQRLERLLKMDKLKKNESAKNSKNKKIDKVPKTFIDDGLDFIFEDLADETETMDDDDLDVFQEMNFEEEDGFGSGDETSNSDCDMGNKSGNEDDNIESDLSTSTENDDTDTEQQSKLEEVESKTKLKSKRREDIHGRLGVEVNQEKDPSTISSIQDECKSEGLCEPQSSGRYIPPALRKSMRTVSERHSNGTLCVLLKGHLNKLTSLSLSRTITEIESLYTRFPTSDVNCTLFELLSDVIIHNSSFGSTPQRLMMEHVALIAALNVLVGNEVGAYFLQEGVQNFHRIFESNDEMRSNKELENYVLFISHLYTFKVCDEILIYDMLNMFSSISSFKNNVQLILIILRSVGFHLRKDNPMKLKTFISNVQEMSSIGGENEVICDTKTKFMLETLLAIKNNNIKKIPNFNDNSLQVSLMKGIRHVFDMRKCGKCDFHPFNIGFKDILQVENRGKWWIVGSAFAGKVRDEEKNVTKAIQKSTKVSAKLMKLSVKMRMNTDVKRGIFCTILSSEDYMDACQKLEKFGGFHEKNKERQIVFVILHCALHQKTFNPFYTHLLNQLVKCNKGRYRLATQFSLWDKIKQLAPDQPLASSYTNLLKFTLFVIEKEIVSFANIVKVIEFTEMNKVYVNFLATLLVEIFTLSDFESTKKIFNTLSLSEVKREEDMERRKLLKDGIVLFVKHFIVKRKLSVVQNRLKHFEPVVFDERIRTVLQLLI